MKRTTFLSIMTICGILFSETSTAQVTEKLPMYLGVHVGGFITAQEKFEQTYDSKLGFAFGGGLGLPVSQHLTLIADASYFAKKGVPEITNYHYDFETGITTIVSKEKIGSAKFRQFIFSGGLQYKFSLSDLYSLGLAMGASYSTVSEDITSPKFWMSVSGMRAFGYFGAVSLERHLDASPFALFADFQYSHAKASVILRDGNFGGANLSAGARFYFNYKK